MSALNRVPRGDTVKRFLFVVLLPLAIPSAAQAGISLVQHTSKDAGTTTSSSLAFTSNNTSGNWIGVCIQARTSGQTFTVTDSKGNTYHRAIQFNETGSGNTLGIYYAENIAAGANTVTVSDTTSAALRFVILEYSGLAKSGSLDIDEAAQGSSTSPNSESSTTTASGDLLLGAILTGASATFTAGSGYTIEESVPAAPNTRLIAEDQIQTNAGSASASATLSASTNWAAGMAAFKPARTIPLVQHANEDAGTTTSASLAFPSANTAGNWIGVCIRGGNSSSQTFTVTDSKGNTYRQAKQIGFTESSVTLAIYYAENILGGTNTVTVSMTVSGPLRFDVLEYSGLATSSSLDVTAGATGTSTSPNSGNATTTANGDLLLGAIATTNTATFTAGTGYSVDDFVPAEPNTKLLAEEEAQAAAGTASASASIAASDTWGAVLAAFKVAGGGGTTPSITSLSPTTGAVGTSVTISGTNFGSSQGTSTVTFNGTTGSPTSWNAGSIVVPVPSAATTGNVVVTVGGLASNGVSFTVVPSITSLSPTSGIVGTSVTITGTTFGTTQGTSTVTFNAITATPTSWSATSIAAPVPAGATTGNVVVTVAGQASNGVSFTVIPPPSITSFTPTSASVGTLVSVTGTNFNANGAAPTVMVTQQGTGTIPASVASFSSTNVSFVIPTGAATGLFTITGNGQIVNSPSSLTITAASSFTLSATPGTATLLPGQTTTVNVSLASSNGFTQLATLAVSGLPSGVTFAFQPQQITAGQFAVLTLTAPSGQAAGASGLTITGSATVQGIAQSSSANVTLQVQGTSGVAFAGRVAVTDPYDTPLVGLTVKMLGVNQTGTPTGCTGSIPTDGAGNFVLNGLSASCAGGQLVQYDPSTVTSPAGTFSGVTLSYQLTSGQVTAPGPPGFIVHLPRVDNAETFSIQQNASVDQTFVSRSIPGVSITVYASTTFTKSDGTQPNPFPLSVVEIPYDRLPEQMPPNPTQDPVFAMSIEPFNSSSSQPVAVSFPNRTNVAPGTNMPLTSLNPTMGIMVNYGTGTISADGTQVVPDLDSAHPGHRYGISHFDWHFPLPGPPAANALNPGTNGPRAGDPIDLASGLPVVTKADIVLGGARGQLAIVRTFRGATTNDGPFGIGTNHNFGYLLNTANITGGLINLIMPDGNQIPFVQSGGIFVNTTRPSFQGATISNLSCLSGSYCTASLRWKDGATWQFQANTSGGINFASSTFLTSIIDSNGNKTTLVRDPSGFAITQIIDPVGRSLSFSYDTPNVFTGHILSIDDPVGRRVQYAYNPQRYLMTVTDVNGGVTTYGYDANNHLQTIQDARGFTYLTNNTFDPIGRVTKQTTIDGAVTLFNYSQANSMISTSPVLVTTVTDPLGNQTTYHFNPAGFLLDVIDVLGRRTVYTRDPGTNLLLGVIDPLGRTTTFAYDAPGNTTSVTRLAGTPNAVTTSFNYDSTFNKVTRVTDPLGHTTSFGYDKAGNLNQVTDALSNVTVLGQDGAGELTSITDPMGNPPTQMTYDGFGNVVQVKDPFGRFVSRVPDAVGRTQSITNPLGQTVSYQYNPFNEVTQITDALNGQTSLSYDANGNIMSVADALGQTHTTNYTYDNMDRILTRTDALGHMECYGTLSGGVCQSGTGYDLNGNLIKFTDRRGKVTTFQYDAVNRRTSASFGPGESTITYSYDAGDRLIQAVDSVTGTISRAYDGLDRLTFEVTPLGSVSYSYDSAGRRTSMTASGQTAVTYQYDNTNRLTQIAQGSATVVIVPNNDSRRQSVTLPNGVSMNYAYDSASQLTGITYKLGTNTLGNLTYAYDLAGRRTGVGGSYARTSVPSAVPAGTPPNVNNQLTQWNGKTLMYDLNGNLTNDGTNTYTWNARNQLVTISGGVNASFQYDAFGRRVSKTINGTTQFLYDGANPVQEISGSSASANLLSGGVDQYFQRTDSAGARSLMTDALGSTLALADSTGTVQTSYTFEPFGNTSVTGATTNSFAFTGRELDPTGLYFFRARYYNPQFGRFISEDPVNFGGGTNTYAYADADPIDLVDPLGLYDIWDFLYDAGTFSEAFADTLTFGSASRLNDALAQAAGQTVPVDRCGWVHKAGTFTGIAFTTVAGGALGAEAAEANAGREGFEFSHWIPARTFRSLEESTGLDLNEGRSILNGNYVSQKFAYLTDPFRYPPPAGAALRWGPKLNPALQQVLRIPWIYPGAAAGAAYGTAGALAGRKSGCQ